MEDGRIEVGIKGWRVFEEGWIVLIGVYVVCEQEEDGVSGLYKHKSQLGSPCVPVKSDIKANINNPLILHPDCRILPDIALSSRGD